MYNLGMNYQPSNQMPTGYQQPSYQYPMTSNYQMPPNYMTEQQRAMQDAKMIQQQPSLMSSMWDDRMDQYSGMYGDAVDSWDNSEGLMGFAKSMMNKGYRSKDQMQQMPQANLNQLGYIDYARS